MSDNKINIAGLEIDNVSYAELQSIVNESITSGSKLAVTYANANTINLIYKDKSLCGLLNSFDIIHPDGAGIYFASKFLRSGFKERITGSDFYPLLAEQCITAKLKLFFFGHNTKTLSKIKEKYPGLDICGMAEGYNYTDKEVIDSINNSKPDILVIGLSSPKQEKWLNTNKDNLTFKAAICVGDGIKVFAGEKKRGPVVLQKIGLEWTARLLRNPVKYFNRYVIGNPLFLYRIIILKFLKFRE